MIWVTGDHHFGHRNILEYCNRPYNNVAEMDAALIDNWNSVVGPDDMVYHLGDFCFEELKVARSIWAQLNGNIKMLLYSWHHDYKWLRQWSGGTEPTLTGYVYGLPAIEVLKLDGRDGFPIRRVSKKYVKVVLCHFPLESWGELIHLHAHSHGKRTQIGLRSDVGVDARNFTPVSLEAEVDRLLALRNSIYTPVGGRDGRNSYRNRR